MLGILAGVSDTMPVPLWKSALAGALALAFLWLGVNGWHDRHVLETQGKSVEARVRDSRRVRDRNGASYEIRYVFQAEEDGKDHTRGDFLGRSNLWSTLPEEEWLQAKATGQVKICYAPLHPDNNAPVDRLPGLGDAWAAIIIGAVLLLGVLLVCCTPRKHGEAA